MVVSPFLFSYIFGIHKQVRDLGGDGQMAHFRRLKYKVRQIGATGFFHLHNRDTGNLVIGYNFLQLCDNIKVRLGQQIRGTFPLASFSWKLGQAKALQSAAIRRWA